MLNKILKAAKSNQMPKISELIERRLGEDKDLIMLQIDEEVYGPHMNEHVARSAVEDMEHDNGSKGQKFTPEVTREHLRSKHKEQGEHKDLEWDFYYVMNMMYSDYSELFGEDADKYARLAMKFINDIDAPKDKVKRYYYMNK